MSDARAHLVEVIRAATDPAATAALRSYAATEPCPSSEPK
jgi:hypothetical protein